MDEKGFISVEYIFSIFIILVIASGILFFSSAIIESSNDVEKSGYHRLILDDAANSVSQVNSNGDGYSKHIALPYTDEFYKITVERNKLTIEYGHFKGETSISLINIDSKYELLAGNDYWIEKNNGKIVIT